MKRKPKILLYFLLTLAAVVVGTLDFPFAANILAGFKGVYSENAAVDLKGIDIDGGRRVYLQGDWEFYWDTLLITDGVKDKKPNAVVTVPSSWTGYTMNGQDIAGGGCASYRLIIKNLNAAEPILISIPDLPAAYRVFFNGKLICESGDVDSRAEQSADLSLFTAYPLTPEEITDNGGDVEIIVEVSSELSGGLTMTPVLANYRSFMAYKMFMLGLRYVFVGILLFVAIVALIFAYPLKRGRAAFGWMSLLCFFLGLRIMISCEGYWAAQLLFGGISYELITFLIYVSTFVIKLILFFYTSRSLSIKLPQSLILVFGIYFLVYAAFPVLLTDNIFKPDSFLLLQMSTFLFDAYMIYRLSEAMTDGVKNALVHTCGYAAVIVGIFVDTLYTNGYINAGISIFMPLMFMVYIGLASYVRVKQVAESLSEESRSAALKNELSELNMSLMLSQIQPHFLYNALNTIKYLIKKDQKTAETALINFSSYLRANMDSLSHREPVPLETELSHVRNYAAIELLRFEDRLNIVYDIRSKSFRLPALTIQPLVENAIKHGVNQKPDGGTVTISAYEDEKNYYVKVADDGAGYDPLTLPDNSRSHIGLENIRSRLDYMLGAWIDVSSKIGIGTDITVTIPKTEKSVLKENE